MLSFDPVGGNLLLNYSVMLVAARLKFHNSFVIGHLRFVCDVRSLFVWCRWLLSDIEVCCKQKDQLFRPYKSKSETRFVSIVRL